MKRSSSGKSAKVVHRTSARPKSNPLLLPLLTLGNLPLTGLGCLLPFKAVFHIRILRSPSFANWTLNHPPRPTSNSTSPKQHFPDTINTTMSSVQDKDLTCRQWKLNPVGCLKGQVDCQYAHGDTGTMSPTSTITCWAWKHGGCKYHPDGCLFAHQDTGVLQTSAFSVRRK